MLNESQNILKRLEVADREHQKEAGGAVMLRSVKYICAAVLFVFLLDVILHLSAGWRFSMVLAMLAGVSISALVAWYLAFIRRNRIEHIARFLETRDSALGSRLINLLQLREQSGDDALAPLTRELARQAVENYSAGLSDVPIESLARTDELRRQMKRAMWALLGFSAILGAAFRVSTVEMARFIDPYGDHPPYSFTHLEIIQPGPAGTNVPYGHGLIVKVKATGHQPREIFLTSFPPGQRGQGLTLPMFEKSGVGYDQLLDNVRGELLVFAHTKDHVSESKQVRIGVVLTPQLEKLFVRIAPPDYTGIKPDERPYLFKGVEALAGSEIRYRLQSNRPLREGSMVLNSGDHPPQQVVLKKTSEKEVAGSFIALDSGRMRFSITDVDGLGSQGDFEGALTVTHDLPPEVRIVNPDHDSFIAMDFKLKVRIEAGDDYGLAEIRLHRGLNGAHSPPKVFKYSGVVRDGRETFDFNIGELGIQPGDVVSLFAEAIDNAPKPHLARSQTVRLQVISVEDYNNFLREQSDMAAAKAKYAELNDDLQTLVDGQKQLGEEIQELKNEWSKADGKQRDTLTQRFDSLVAKQAEMNEKLNSQAERMEHFVRENPLYDVEKEMQAMLREQAQTVRESTRTNDIDTRKVAQRSSPPSGPRRLSADMLADFKKASDEQVARLIGMHEETEKEAVQTLEDMVEMQELIKDFNQFEALCRVQQDLAQQAQAYNRPGQMMREDQLALKDLAATEKEVSDMLSLLQDRLRQDAQTAEKHFPKAAKSGRDLADQIGQRRLAPLADLATSQMLAGGGEQSFQLAERLRAEMEKMFSECKGGNCPSSKELDTYLQLQGFKPNRNFAQMSRSRIFGFGTGRGKGFGRGEGAMGTSGYAMTDGATMNVLGNESSIRSGSKSPRDSSPYGKGAGTLETNGKSEIEKADPMKGLKPVNRQSGVVASEAVLDQYSDVVENYFRTITTRKEKPVNEK